VRRYDRPVARDPVIGYTKLGDRRIAYQVLGDGPIDLLITAGYWGSFDVEWDDPMIRLFHERVASFTRVIRFDRLGTGASDSIPTDSLPPWEAFVEEIECVLDAVNSERAALFAISDAGPAAMLFAASRPDRCRALILFNSSARALHASDYPFGLTDEQIGSRFDHYVPDDWGTAGNLSARLFFPSKASDPRFVRWVARLERGIASPEIAMNYSRATVEADARSLLSSIRVPTLVLHRTEPTRQGLRSIEHGRYLANHIQDASLVELPGGDFFPYWESPDLTISAVERLLSGTHAKGISNRKLASVMFTDIVDSTRRAESMGDRKWGVLIDLHDEAALTILETFGGRLVKTTGDGILGTFDGPGRALRAAFELRAELERLDLEIRCGIHVGELELRQTDVAGIAVHIASRVMAAAAPGEILVTATVKDLVVGSEHGFADRGQQNLKGVEGEWQLFAVSD
jgi:class 3 adenylate cyclase/pimeloyl-ACP methyl ester carboxylesterase